MNIKQLLTDEEAVSPVIGVILMVAITVILAAVIGTFVLGLGDQVQSTSPQASFNFDYTADDGATTGQLEITHDGGDSIPAQLLNVRTDTDFVGTGVSATQDASYTDFDAYSSGDSVSAGSSLTIKENPTAGTKEFDSMTARIVWQSETGENSATLGNWAGPSA